MPTLELSINEKQTKAFAESMIQLVKNLREVNQKVIAMASDFDIIFSTCHNKTSTEFLSLKEDCQSLQDACDELDK